MIILLVSMYSNLNLFCTEGNLSTLTIESIHGLDVDVGDNSGGIMDNKLFRMAVEFGLTEGICLLKNICLSPVGGVDPGSEIIAPVLYISADIVTGSIVPPVVSFKMKRKKSIAVFIKAIGGALLGETIGILLFWNSESPLYNLGTRRSWSHLPATFFSVIAINL